MSGRRSVGSALQVCFDRSGETMVGGSRLLARLCGSTVLRLGNLEKEKPAPKPPIGTKLVGASGYRGGDGDPGIGCAGRRKFLVAGLRSGWLGGARRSIPGLELVSIALVPLGYPFPSDSSASDHLQ